ncbi:MAG: HAD hydrolase family protein [Clostridium sp.]|uniref:HAD hydrolase family protein n=1 Tax=Clostridium sp. TaxID=1506 RepID=UPI0030465928
MDMYIYVDIQELELKSNRKLEEIVMPRIGMRIIKSAIAVFICCLIYLVSGVGIPFHSSISAILSMQPGVANSMKAARSRSIGTIIGGIFGIIVLIIERQFIPDAMILVRYLLVSLAIIPLIYITILLEKQTASYISCVAFLSVTISHGLDVSPYAFGFSRIIDTLIGVFVSLGVNSFHLPKRKNSKILFIADLETTVLDSKKQIDTYTKIKLHEMLEEDALITVSTYRTPSTLLELMDGIDIKLPIITMNGAALYDLKKNTYISCKTIEYLNAKKISDIFKDKGLNCFIHTIINDVLHIYYGDFKNPLEKDFYNKEKLRHLKNYIYSDLPENREVVYFKAMDKLKVVKELYNEIIQLNFASKIRVKYEEDSDNPGYYILEVYSIEATKSNALMSLKGRMDCDMTVYFGGNIDDIPMLNQVDYVYAVDNAQEELKEIADYTIGNNDTNSVIKTIVKLFYSRKKLERKYVGNN